MLANFRISAIVFLDIESGLNALALLLSLITSKIFIGFFPFLSLPSSEKYIILPVTVNLFCEEMYQYAVVSQYVKGVVFRMIRAKIWFRCAVVHDPVSPIIVQPALIGWEAKQRQIDLTIERAFKGDELLRRMKGWITVDPAKVIEVVNEFGRLKVLDDRELVVEIEDRASFDNLKKNLFSTFGNEVDVELI